MAEYNAAFFGALTRSFIILKEWQGEEFALKFMRELMTRNLGAAYDAIGGRRLHGKSEYQRCVGERDASVGLKVSFEDEGANRLAYRFHTDPFPNLKGHVDPRRLDDTYMRFKVDYFFGPSWTYLTPKHLWEGALYTEHVIEKQTG